MPLVRTAMIAPTKIYNYAPAWSVDKASSLVVEAAINKTKRVKTVMGQTMEMSYAVAPKFNDSLLALSGMASAALYCHHEHLDRRWDSAK